MSTEAAVADKAPAAPVGVDQQTPAPSPEVSQDTIPEGGNTPEAPPEVDASGTPPPQGNDVPFAETQIQTYQDVVAKHNADPTYEMSDAEAEAFLFVQDKIAAGEMKDPGPAKKADDKPPEEPPEKKTDKDGDPTSDGEGDEPVIEDVDPEAVAGISDKNSDVLISAMKRVGAKDISELDGKIEGLIKHMKSSGGKQGSELAALREREANHKAWLKDLREGKPAALDFLKQTVGIELPSKTESKSTKQDGGNTSPASDDLSDDDYLDDKLAAEVKDLKKLVKDQADVIDKLQNSDKQRSEANSRKAATDGWVDDIVDLVTQNQKAFGLKPAEARGLAQDYWAKGPTQPVHPKFQGIHELLKFAYERNMPDLNSAYIVWHHENGHYAQKLIEATKDGQKSAQHKPSQNAFISKQQSKMKSNVPSPNISEEDVQRMANGDFDAIPDEWMDADGNLMPSKVPERFHAAAFGKLGKPK